MPVITIPYKPRELQKEFHKNLKRWNVVVAHRRFGKSVMVVNELIKRALKFENTKELHSARFAYISPSYKMSKEIIWDYLKFYSQVIPGIKFNESELRVDFPNGARIKLYGADNPDSLRGIYLDGCVFDEFAQCKPSIFTEIIRPALSDRKGFCIFIGTPKGKNFFYSLYKRAGTDEDWTCYTYKASDTGYVDSSELKEAAKHMSEDEYAQEFECSFEAAIKGAFYSKEIQEARKEKRICKVPYDKNIEVHTAWDIGFRDDTAIIFFQRFGKEIRIIDCYSNSGMTIAEYSEVLTSKGYRYGRHFFPWDAKIKPMSSGKSTLDVASEYGIIGELTPSVSVLEGINQVRLSLPNCWFDEEKTADLIESLTNYRREYDEKKQAFRANPLHDINSHFADSMRYLCLSLEDEVHDDGDKAERMYLYKNNNIEFNF